MKLQTKIPLKQASNLIDYDSRLVFLGSCFSENIGQIFSDYKFQMVQNPFGILFHPAAIERFLQRAVEDYQFDSKDVFQHNERWHSFDAHSRLSQPHQEELIQNLNSESNSAKAAIKKATHVFITLGTAWGYLLNETHSLVANCHKLPQKNFTKVLFSVDEVKESLAKSVKAIRSLNEKVSIIFTISPVRHLKDGFVENMQSKAHLISAVHQMKSEGVFYFPSYEIVMDELRDYRFYSEDMIHLNKIGIDYIWERLISVWLSPEAEKTMEAILKIQKGLQHIPFNADSRAHQEFLQKLETQKAALQKRYKHLKF
ncbi:GSCFA domain-containing protein [Gaetbulibacter aestuarii]|uniref:GSCFA domain-containing protein n=1 Tax=Gaetbulibacter aestuarii TaxID=1502358 RepID=A0ABW7MZR7_9FLAO